MEFSKRLKELRLKHGLTQEELGRMLGVTGANCTRYEKGLAQPKMATLIKMSQIFGVSIDYLLGNDELAAESVEGKQSAAAYWSKILAPEFKIEYRDGYFYLTALQDIALPLNDIKAGNDYKMNCYDFNNIVQNIENSVQKIIEKERKEKALQHFKMAISFDFFVPFAFTALQNGVDPETIKERMKVMLNRHNEE